MSLFRSALFTVGRLSLAICSMVYAVGVRL